MQPEERMPSFFSYSTKAGEATGHRAGSVTSSRRTRCLMIVAFEALSIGTVEQHVNALRKLSRHDVEIVNVWSLRWLKSGLSRFDVIVFHYSIVIAQGYHIGAEARSRLAASSALKVLFIQDEYRWVDATAEAIRELGIGVLFTVVNEDVAKKIYHHPWLEGVRIEHTLTGFVDESLLKRSVPSYLDRTIDVAYRARKVPFWLGSFAMEKWTIGERFRQQAEKCGLCCDISSDESARLYGEFWIRFLSNAKAVLGTESGASVCDFSGELQAGVEAAVRDNPEIDFHTVQKEVLCEADGRIIIRVVSPRIFEAAALRTLMINYPGTYSGRLIPWRHYVPLAKDHSNLEEVASVIRDPQRAAQIIDAAYREVACSPQNSFRSMVMHFDRVVSDELRLPSIETHDLSGYERRRRWSSLEVLSYIDLRVRPIASRLFGPLRWIYRRVLPLRFRAWLRNGIAK